MDSSRTALRIGAKSTLVYRRAREQMPARKEEVHHAEQEGVNLQLLTNPKRVIADENGKVVALECVKMELGEPDESGRRSVTEIPGSEFQIPCDAIVVSIGNRPNPLIPMTCKSPMKLFLCPVKPKMHIGTGMPTLIPTWPPCVRKANSRAW